MEKFQDLNVWKKAHELVRLTYKLTENFPQKEIFGLVSQMRRAAVSVAANIAEGSKRTSNKDRVHFHTMSAGSLEELKYFFILSCDLKFISEAERESALEIARHTGAMLYKLSETLKA
ncbi:MAG: hypothetical protein UW30_C0004G0016 [Candidatus Giovannonibacteria bacterium GW2011_GWA2_44_13b]|uniref:Four helix bundle protein n=2 Tax=Candidatus Giovannoniibacteriota TaxID=1752738 RepID=A0A0G1JCR1_9BACT|nr:MAG: hypothetical protein UW30_C0004G0016 [Candidatus Giovannonibacteria bacterium GW2011_GWA2_44_13b]OGF81677.1 MAG: hypothetical protein A2924_03635 [Candidatus Giovannonibacteria bacterium RIFCSPLOWO2_01_FULL_44_16]